MQQIVLFRKRTLFFSQQNIFHAYFLKLLLGMFLEPFQNIAKTYYPRNTVAIVARNLFGTSIGSGKCYQPVLFCCED